MKDITLADVETAVKTIAATALENEQYFCELDSYAGDADFGVSLATGFRAIQNDWNELDRSSIGNFLLKISMIITRNVGGCSGPIWGTGFMRAGMLSKERATLTLDDLDKMLSAAIEGIQKRGGAQPGDKTLLDALIPIRDIVHDAAAEPDADAGEVLAQATRVANDAIERTKPWVAKRGRQQFTGERSANTPDPGIVAIATMMNEICASFGVKSPPRTKP
ncbi:MAG TPA: dihydroxyacetone kinase subunit DhaL [Gammaproteobacteria bacterium]|nr:dihydroxyacetone kinase subunit DhaL [Gammaproteobacteria bacterium]